MRFKASTPGRRRARNLFLIAGVVSLAAAAGSLAPSPTVVGVVDLGAVFNGLDAWTDFQDRKIALAEQAQADAAARRESIEELQADLEDYPESSDRHRSALRDLQLAAIEFEASLQLAERKLQQFESRRIRELYESIRIAAGEFAQAEGYDLVLVDDGVDPIPEDTADPIAMISSRRVLHAAEDMNITSRLIEAMNKRHHAESGG